jgi:hypothetical protein
MLTIWLNAGVGMELKAAFSTVEVVDMGVCGSRL